MKFSSIYAIASLAAVGMAAPAIVRREDSAPVAELVNSADSLDGALTTLGGQSTTASEAAAPATVNAVSPYIITISATISNLERSNFDKLTSISKYRPPPSFFSKFSSADQITRQRHQRRLQSD